MYALLTARSFCMSFRILSANFDLFLSSKSCLILFRSPDSVTLRAEMHLSFGDQIWKNVRCFIAAVHTPTRWVSRALSVTVLRSISHGTTV